ncbi:hypothetical protein [Mycobacterium shigaense]|uniref:Uncharacterized protein n=1 Tax=Mycobacterium shigaense TaxID=722731 RepID=A0A1Z4ED00_9MYCO|nr:hypothetical protein [Mycobacterium shigaense]PRI16986.1 hypothetical protein B2J96_00485 [Mycobacterium shigaense]BAX90823.1 hypothetical protein MSG_00659 [Mycobacterium shigaense]
MRTQKRVDFARLAAALPDYPFAYLITVGDDYRVHTVTVEPQLRDTVLDIGLVGGGTRANLARRGDVTVLWPPTVPGGYSLIVDGQAELSEVEGETARCRIVPTRALLHRNADSPAAAKGCLHDCVVFSLPA